MTEPFPLLFEALPPVAPEPDSGMKVSSGEAIVPLFEASVRGVQTRFPHLSEADIAAPPHHWFDAALARQIALHLLIHQFGQPKRAVAEELARSREAVNRALRTIDERLQYPEFQDTYSEMAEGAQAALLQGDDTDEQD